jgi:hypothetical protein
MARIASPGWTSAAALAEVRPQVRDFLTAVPAFARLAPEEQTALARDMVKVMSYIVDPNAVSDTVADRAPPRPCRPPLWIRQIRSRISAT